MIIYDVDMPLREARNAIAYHFRKNGKIQDSRFELGQFFFGINMMFVQSDRDSCCERLHGAGRNSYAVEAEDSFNESS